jgi:hypothetical protein
MAGYATCQATRNSPFSRTRLSGNKERRKLDRGSTFKSISTQNKGLCPTKSTIWLIRIAVCERKFSSDRLTLTPTPLDTLERRPFFANCCFLFGQVCSASDRKIRFRLRLGLSRLSRTNAQMVNTGQNGSRTLIVHAGERSRI